jgi:fatty-acyl-CoA synthase
MAVRLIPRTPSAYGYPLLIKNLLLTPLVYSPHQEIVYRDIKRYDYVTFRKRIAKLANALKGLGINQGDTVAVMDWDSHRYLECYFAVPMMGAVLHTINIRLSTEQILYTINHAEDAVILVNSDFLPLLESIKDNLATVRKIILLTDGEKHPATSLSLDGEYEDLVEHSPDEYDFPDFDENAMATTSYTTGTTGAPKGVYYSHRQLVLHALGTIAGLFGHKSQISADSSDVYMPLTPMFHVHAWGFPYLWTSLGAKQVYPGRYEPEVIIRLFEREKVTFSHCVPTIFHMLLNSPAAAKVDLSGWKFIVGGSAVPKSMCKTALERGINLTQAYGMSETAPLLTIAFLKPHMLNCGLEKEVETRCRTGLPLPLVNLRIVDAQGKDVPHDGVSVGEVVVRTPWATQGYSKDPERAEELWNGGWLHTGDIGSIDPEGYLQVTDRIKDVIKTGGEWVSSLQLEDIMTQHSAVSEAAAIGIPDSKWGERPLMLVTLREEWKGKVTEAELKAFFLKFVEEAVIPKYAIPDKIVLTDSIAKTSVGKIDKKRLRQQFVQFQRNGG